MHPALEWFNEMAHAHGLRYWVDSGTLLGLVREGRLLTHDHDIDIGMWEADVDALVALKSDLAHEGTKLSTLTLEGRVYKVKLSRTATGGMPITIHAFRRAGDYAWAYQFHVCRLPPLPPSPHANYGSVSMLFFRHVVRRFRDLDKFIRKNVSIDRRARHWPFNQWNWVYTWCVPAGFFDELTVDARTGLVVPRAVEEYLEFRYGDWRVPRLDWQYYRDDPSLIHEPPRAVLERIEMGHDPWMNG